MKIMFEGSVQDILAEVAEYAVLNSAIPRELIQPKGRPDDMVTHEEAQELAAEKPKRRSRKSKAETAEAEPEAEEKPKRRSRKKADADEISDIDLTKAASDAAEVLTPAGVMEILEQFAVGSVNELDRQVDRRKFLNLLKAAIEEAGEEEPEEEDEPEEDEKPKSRRRRRRG